jgi:hypothetical protein
MRRICEQWRRPMLFGSALFIATRADEGARLMNPIREMALSEAKSPAIAQAEP